MIDALLEKQVPTQLIAVLAAWWSQSEVSVRLQSISSHRQMRVQRGVPQGAPESPLFFVMTSDYALNRLQTRWALTDAGWSLDTALGPLWVSCLAYADDVLVFAKSELALSQSSGTLVSRLRWTTRLSSGPALWTTLVALWLSTMCLSPALQHSSPLDMFLTSGTQE